MKLALENKDIYSSPSVNDIECKIESNPLTFKFLSDKLYSNKISSVIREICSNAIDASVEADSNIPIKVIAPTTITPKFTVRDFGIGMSHERLINNYSTYFSSTKRDSNSQIGAFGLGSKSPLSYTDSFSITSIHKGIKNTLVVYYNEQNVPALKFIQENEKTGELDGTEVSIPVKANDIEQFATDIQNYEIGFFDKPGLLEFVTSQSLRTKNLCFLLSIEGLTIFANKPNWHFSDCYLRVGGVLYNVEYGYEYTKLKGRPFRIYDAEIGDVDVTGSREELEYTEKTKNFLKTKIETKDAEVESLLTSMEFYNMKEWLQFSKIYHKIFNDSFTDENGDSFGHGIALPRRKTRTESYGLNGRVFGQNYRTELYNVKYVEDPETRFILVDKCKYKHRRFDTLKNSTTPVYVIENVERMGSALRRFQKKMTGFEFTLLSEIEPAYREPKEKSPKIYGTTAFVDSWDASEIDEASLKSAKYCFLGRGGIPYKHDRDFYNSVRNCLNEIEATDITQASIICPQSTIDKYDLIDLSNKDTFVNIIYDIYKNSNVIPDHIAESYKLERSNVDTSLLENLVKMKVVKGEFKKFISEVIAMRQNGRNFYYTRPILKEHPEFKLTEKENKYDTEILLAILDQGYEWHYVDGGKYETILKEFQELMK